MIFDGQNQEFWTDLVPIPSTASRTRSSWQRKRLSTSRTFAKPTCTDASAT